MRRMLINTSDRRGGFTIVEVIVIVTVAAILTPLVLNTLGDFYSANVDSLKRSTQDTDARSVLRTVEKELAYTSSFLGPQSGINPLLGPDNSTSGSSTWPITHQSNDVLIASAYASATNSSGQRVPILYQPDVSYDCTQPTNDMALKETVIYFVDTDISNASIKNLYRRTILGSMPTGSQCDATLTATHKTTCRSNVTTGVCTRNAQTGTDALVLRDIDTFDVEYYALANSTSPVAPTTNPASAKITVTPKKRGNITPVPVDIRITPIR